MSELMARLQERFRSAEVQADAAKSRSRRASAKRLQSLLAEPKPSARLAGLKDPTLTAFDRVQLERAIADEMPARRRRRDPASGSRNLRALARHAGYHRRRLAVLVAVLAPALAVTTVGGWRTPALAEPVHLSSEFQIRWKFPDGLERRETLPSGTDLVWLRRDGQGYLRRWFPNVGYGEAVISDETVRLHVYRRP